MHTVVRKGHLGLTRLLLSHNARIDIPDNLGWSPLHEATSENRPDCLRLLVEFAKVGGVFLINDDPSSQKQRAAQNEIANSIHTNTSISHENGQVDSSQKEKKLPNESINQAQNGIKGPENNQPNEENQNQIEKAEMVNEKGESTSFYDIINWHDKEMCTALHLAARCGNVDCLKILVECGAEIDCIDESLWTPLHEAVNEGLKKF